MILKNISYKPNSFLSNYIDRIYFFNKTSDTGFNFPVLPGTGLELLFHLDETVLIKNQKMEQAHIICPRNITYFNKNKSVSFISVRFKSGAFRHFTDIPYSNLNDNYVSVIDIWKNEGYFLLERIAHQKTIKNKIYEIEEFLAKVFLEKHKVSNNWDSIIDTLYYNYNSISIKELAKHSNLSLRQFERTFKLHFGISAKQFQKLTRFQKTVKEILLDKKSNYLDTALDKGYFDQSHFIRDFKVYTQQAPLTYLTPEKFENHLFHSSFKK